MYGETFGRQCCAIDTNTEEKDGCNAKIDFRQWVRSASMSKRLMENFEPRKPLDLIIIEQKVDANALFKRILQVAL